MNLSHRNLDQLPTCAPPSTATSHFSQCHDLEHEDWASQILLYADVPHPKRKLRLQAALEIVENNLFTLRSRRKRLLLIKKVCTKFKPMEWAKPGKFGRNIVDLSVVGSLLAGFTYDRLKSYMTTFRYRGTRFVKSTNYDLLTPAFQSLINPDPYSFCYFSDDSSFSFKEDGKPVYYNTGIVTGKQIGRAHV